MPNTSLDVGGHKWTLLAAFAGMVLALLAGGGFYYRAESERIRQEKYEGIRAIGEAKAGEIARWRGRRVFDVEKFATSPILRRAAEAILREPGDQGRLAEMRERLKLEQEGDTYADALLLSPDGKILLSARDVPDPVDPATARAVVEALESRTAVFADLFRCPSGIIHVDVVQAMYGTDGAPLVVVVLRSDAAAFLYPLIQSWPTPSKSAETLLIRRSGDEVVFLNELRHQSGAALSLRFPSGRTDVPAVQAVLGGQGMFQGTDYRGVEVLADLRPVPDSDWFLVAKVDTGEILTEARYRARVIALFVAFATVFAAFATTVAYRRRQMGLFRELYESERQRRMVKEELHTAFYSLGDAVITTDEAGRVRHMNPVAERLTGWTEAEAEDKPLEGVFRIFHEETRAVVESPVTRVLREGQVVGLANHTLLVSKDAKEWPIADSGAPIRSETGETTGVVLVFRDQVEERAARRALLESERKFRDAIEHLDEGYYSCSLDGLLQVHNIAFNRILGFPTDQDLKGTKLPDFWQNPNDRERYLAELMSTGSVRNFLINAKTIGGEEIVTMANSHLVKDEEGKAVRIEGTFSDFTERVRMEEEVRCLNTELEQRVRDRTVQLEASNKELEAFSYSVSHDLRAPLRAIDGFTRILSDDYGARLDDEARRICGIIRENTGKMGQLIDDLLTFSRLGRTEMQPSTIDMAAMARAVFDELTTPEQRARVDFQLEALPSVVGDPSLMRQVWTNLLANALKFSSKRERIVIRVTSETKDGEVTFAVRDNGAGFDMQYVHKLFGVFQRLHTSREFEGTGVGLALVQRVIRRHSGRVWAEGEPGSGATFHFALPLKGS